MPLRVYGVMIQDGHTTLRLPAGVSLVVMRDLAAASETVESAARATEVDPSVVERHLDVVRELFDQEAVLPAPPGTVFRTDEVLTRWMELHYVALSDALAWVEGRYAARVHITRAQAREADKEAGTDLAAVAAEISRSLRRHAVSTVPLRNEEVTGIVLTAAYLVERELWSEFGDAVAEEGDKHPLVKIALTGPWPPYDFVRMQFGA